MSPNRQAERAGAPIYLDHHATTPVDPRVLQAMLPFFSERFGNPASHTHAFGHSAEDAVEKARAHVASLIGARPSEIVFTSGATESDNLALLGVAAASPARGDHIIIGITEHPAVLDPARRLAEQGWRLTRLPVDGTGRVDPDEVRRALTSRTFLISLMLANNEIGTLHPIAAVTRVAREAGALVHTDASQAAGRLPIRVDELDVDLLSLSAHKIHGPKGVGALFVRRRGRRVRIAPLLVGGGHERGLRSGTLNVPGIVGFGEACRLAQQEMAEESARLRGLRDRLYELIAGALDRVELNGHPTERLPNNLNLSFDGVEGESLMAAVPEIAVSTGSACASASRRPSHVLQALGKTDDAARSSLRFGLGRFNTGEEIESAARLVVAAVRRLRSLSPLYEVGSESSSR